MPPAYTLWKFLLFHWINTILKSSLWFWGRNGQLSTASYCNKTPVKHSHSCPTDLKHSFQKQGKNVWIYLLYLSDAVMAAGSAWRWEEYLESQASFRQRNAGLPKATHAAGANAQTKINMRRSASKISWSQLIFTYRNSQLFGCFGWTNIYTARSSLFQVFSVQPVHQREGN